MTTANLPSTEVLSPEAITALLREKGFLDSGGPSMGPRRIKIDGTTFEVGDDIFVSNPKTGEPAFVAQLAGQPRQYQARYFDPEKADDVTLLNMMNRPHLLGEFCKSYFDEPSQQRERNEKGDSCRGCLINPFVKKAAVPAEANGKKCQWRGEFALRILDAEHRLVSDEVFLLDVSTTGMIEWQGMSSEPEKGYVSDLNSMQRLANLGAAKNPANPREGIFTALTALNLGLVLVEVRAIRATTNGMNFSVPSLNPIDILPIEDQPALPGGEADPVPF